MGLESTPLHCCSHMPLCAPPVPSLEAEGLEFFKRDWRYQCFVWSGEADGLEALLGTSRRQLATRQAEGERHRELAER